VRPPKCRWHACDRRFTITQIRRNRFLKSARTACVGFQDGIAALIIDIIAAEIEPCPRSVAEIIEPGFRRV